MSQPCLQPCQHSPRHYNQAPARPPTCRLELLLKLVGLGHKGVRCLLAHLAVGDGDDHHLRQGLAREHVGRRCRRHLHRDLLSRHHAVGDADGRDPPGEGTGPLMEDDNLSTNHCNIATKNTPVQRMQGMPATRRTLFPTVYVSAWGEALECRQGLRSSVGNLTRTSPTLARPACGQEKVCNHHPRRMQNATAIENHPCLPRPNAATHNVFRR
jgi:hypothetical protein